MVETVHAMPTTRHEASGFERFFEAEYPRLARALFLVTSDAAEAEDVAQEAMVRLYERWERVASMHDPAGYLFRTAMNLSRSRRRRLLVATRRALGPRTVPTPAGVAETRDELDRALAALPTGQRQALVLVEWLGMSDGEAASILGIQPVSVRVRVSRARATLWELREDDHD